MQKRVEAEEVRGKDSTSAERCKLRGLHTEEEDTQAAAEAALHVTTL